MIEQTFADPPRVCGRDGLREAGHRHPVDAHRSAGFLDRKGQPRAIADDVLLRRASGDGNCPTTAIVRVPAINADDTTAAVIALRQQSNEPIGLEIAMPLKLGTAASAKPEHGPAEHEWLDQRRSGHVFHDPRQARRDEQFARLGDAIDVRFLSSTDPAYARMRLARWTSVDRIEAGDERAIERQAIGLDELKRVARLRLDIDADDIEAGLVIAHASAAGAAEQIEELGARHSPLPAQSGPAMIAHSRAIGCPIGRDRTGGLPTWPATGAHRVGAGGASGIIAAGVRAAISGRNDAAEDQVGAAAVGAVVDDAGHSPPSRVTDGEGVA